MKKEQKILFVLVGILLLCGCYFLSKGTYSGNMDRKKITFDYSLDVDDDSKMISSLTEGISVSELLSRVELSDSANIQVNDSNGSKKKNTDVIFTGDVIVLSDGNGNSLEYNLSVIGDASGDGSIDLIDLIQMRKHIVSLEESNTENVAIKRGVYLESIDLNSDEEIDLLDLIKLRKILVRNVESLSIKMNVRSSTITVGEKLQIKYSISPSNVVNSSVTWKSSDTKVATVKNGKVSAVGVGEAVISVTTNDSGKKATAKVVVKESSNIDDAILPTGNETITFEEYKDTLKVWIETITRTGKTQSYVTHIWVKDPYNQFKEQMPDNFGKELLSTETLLANAIKKNKFENKLVVGVNASGFALGGIWATDFIAANAGYDKTSTSPLVLDGVDANGNLIIKRDYSGDKPLSWYNTIYGMDRNGDLKWFKYKSKNAANMTEEEIIDWNKSISKKIQNAGVLYTFAFNPVLVKNGENALTEYWINKDGSNIRQGFCQIDNNNFIFITDKYVKALNGFSYSEMAEYMISLGCKTGFNLDGGGSTTLVYKKSNEEKVKVVWGVNGSNNGNRPVADMIYFHE